ncbi:hypothetical protein JCM9279_006628 [Rhodotorula babjevae]
MTSTVCSAARTAARPTFASHLARPSSSAASSALTRQLDAPARSGTRTLHSRLLSTTATRRSAEDMTNIIYSTPNDPVSITSLSPKAGFTLSDGMVVPAPILLIDGQCFLWDVQHPTSEGKDPRGFEWDGWSVDKVKVFEALSPRPEILLVGTGTATQFAPPHFKKYLNSLGIQVDVLDSRNAASTYNLLQEEGRRVAAALYPVSLLSARTGLTA